MRSVIALSALLCCSYGAFADPSADCRLLAASPQEPDIKAGVSFDKIDIEKALGPCEAAARSNDATSADKFRFARVLSAKQSYVESSVWIREAANAGYAPAQNNLGAAYQSGEGLPKDMALAAEWYRKSSDQGLAKAQYNLGLLYENGVGVPKDISAAVHWFNKAADAGNSDAQYRLGRNYLIVDSGFLNRPLAEQWLQKSGNQGNIAAQQTLGYYYKSSGNKQSAVWFQKAADQGDASSEFELGMSYLMSGQHVAAAEWFKKAAAQGERNALSRLGYMEWKGQGVPQDTKLATQHLQQAVQMGSTDAAETLADMNGQPYQADNSASTTSYAGVATGFVQMLSALAKHHAENGYYDKDSSGMSEYDRYAAEVDRDSEKLRREQDEITKRSFGEQTCALSGQHYDGFSGCR